MTAEDRARAIRLLNIDSRRIERAIKQEEQRIEHAGAGLVEARRELQFLEQSLYRRKIASERLSNEEDVH